MGKPIPAWSYVAEQDIVIPLASEEERAGALMREAMGIELPDCGNCKHWHIGVSTWCNKYDYIQDAPNMRAFKHHKNTPLASSLCDDYKTNT